MGAPKVVFHGQREISKRPERQRMATLGGPLLPAPKPAGRPIKYPRREVVNGIRYVMRTGCAWRMLPHDLHLRGASRSTTSAHGVEMGPWSGFMKRCVTGYA